MSAIDDMSKAELLELLGSFAKNWLAHDGIWFQTVEQVHGLEQAIQFDTAAWARFSPIEARRIKRFLGLPERPGLEGLERALDLRMYALLNRQSSVRRGNKLLFYMNECRVQRARHRKGLPDFPCKPVGLVEYSTFAREIDPRIETRCISCPPDEGPAGFHCGWEFLIEA